MGDSAETTRQDGGSEIPKLNEPAKALSDYGIRIDDTSPPAELENKESLSEVIDPGARKAAEELAKKELRASEKAVQDEYGGNFFKISDLPGMENSRLGSEVHISTPDMTDERFKGKKPRVICWFHQNGGQAYDNVQSKKVYELVKNMRENGDPVVLIMPQDNDRKRSEDGKWNWGAMQNPEAFSKIIEQAEKLTGRRLGADISLGSSSGGCMGVAGVLKELRQSNSPRAKELYKGIRQIGLCDSLYGQETEIAKWFVDDSKGKTLHAYGGTESVHRHTEALRKSITKTLEERGETVGANLDVPAERLKSIGHDVDPAHLAAYLSRKQGDVDYLEKSESYGKGIRIEPAVEVVQAPEIADTQPTATDVATDEAPAPVPPSASATPDSSVVASAGSFEGRNTSSQTATLPVETVASPRPSPEATVSESSETLKSRKVFVLGDSLSDGFITGFSGLDVRHANPANKDNSRGQTATEMVKTLENVILKNDVKGTTLVVVGGSNDIFASESIEGIKTALGTIYRKAKQAGMKVVAGTVPPLAYSSFAKEWAKRTNTPYEEYNNRLIERWKALNSWIAEGPRGEGEVAPDSVVRLDQKLEDPNTPGKLRADLFERGDGVHLPDYGEMSKLLREEAEKKDEGSV